MEILEWFLSQSYRRQRVHAIVAKTVGEMRGNTEEAASAAYHGWSARATSTDRGSIVASTTNTRGNYTSDTITHKGEYSRSKPPDAIRVS